MINFPRFLVLASIVNVGCLFVLHANAADTCEAFEVNSSVRDLEQAGRVGEQVVTYDVKVICLTEAEVAAKCSIVVINGDTVISCPKTATK